MKRLDPDLSIWPTQLISGEEGEVYVPLTGADWNALVERVESLEAALTASKAETRS